jgi:hypothetical protein
MDALLHDPARCQALGRAGYDRVARVHNWQQAAATVDRLLERLG